MPGMILLVGAVLALVGGAAVVALAFRKPATVDGDATALAPAGVGGPSSRAAVLDDPSPLISLALSRLGMTKRVQRALLQAGLLVRPSEIIALGLGLAAIGFTIGFFVRGWPGALVLTAAGGYLPVIYVNLRSTRRRQLLVAQLSDALAMMASSLRSGYSFMRAMQVVKDEMEPPIAEEFGRVLDELNVGVSQERALKHLLDRCPNPDIELVVTACQIQSTVGGNLAEILDTTADMIRERVRLQGEIAALTAEGRLSAGILTALPIVLALVVNRLSPGYLSPLVETKLGLVMLGGGVGAMMMGVLIIKKMLAVRI